MHSATVTSRSNCLKKVLPEYICKCSFKDSVGYSQDFSITIVILLQPICLFLLKRKKYAKKL